ncbi:DUF2922 domain-containing protein [Enterococcus pseudoavium]|uniref:DUF2922 domain-containing protein n=1 Tax=Enterococcus pseudoavium TaxID=44007 RepID=A0ABU3FI41_9ENTE|nr:DUF2922 domain-containing protein [Enterococcus pseudoavium]MDT2770736.1 DUF2922 domain-containing protein [Enterococcus pseudoavium]
MLKLSATFENSLGKTHRWTFSEPNKELSSLEIQEQLERMSDLALFEKDGAQLYTKATSAKFVETIETPIF